MVLAAFCFCINCCKDKRKMFKCIFLVASLLHCCMRLTGTCVSSSYGNINKTATPGETVFLSCEVLESCPRYVWRIYPSRYQQPVYWSQRPIDLSINQCSNTICHIQRDKVNVIRINVEDDVSAFSYFQCACAWDRIPPTNFACQQLVVVLCRISVMVDGIERVSNFGQNNES